MIPQSLAYAGVAELPVQYGLYAAFPGVMIYCLLGTAKDITIGPTAIMSALIASAAGGDITTAILTTLVCGCMQLFLGIFRFGFLVDYITYPVISAFICAAAITIGSGQIKKIVGYHLDSDLTLLIPELFEGLDDLKGWNFIMGYVCVSSYMCTQIYVYIFIYSCICCYLLCSYHSG